MAELSISSAFRYGSFPFILLPSCTLDLWDIRLVILFFSFYLKSFNSVLGSESLGRHGL